MIKIDKTNCAHGYRLVLLPNRSIRWRELLIFYLFMCLVVLLVGLFFAVQGLWLVLPFAGLEMLTFGIALYLVSRDSSRRQIITINNSKVRVEKGVYHCDQSWEFKSAWVRLNYRYAGRTYSSRKLELGVHGSYIEVGEFLSNIEKDALAFQLKDCIIRA